MCTGGGLPFRLPGLISFQPYSKSGRIVRRVGDIPPIVFLSSLLPKLLILIRPLLTVIIALCLRLCTLKNK